MINFLQNSWGPPARLSFFGHRSRAEGASSELLTDFSISMTHRAGSTWAKGECPKKAKAGFNFNYGVTPGGMEFITIKGVGNG